MPVVAITGASSGLGAHLAEEMARRGHSLGLVARRVDQLEAVRARVAAHGVPVAVAPADVTDPAATKAAFAALEAELGPIDVLVANAGVLGPMRDLRHLDLDSIRRTFEINVFGAIHAVDAVLPGMLDRDSGHLVVISSVAANRGLPKSAPYSASKAAISIFWEGLRVDLHRTGITCTTVHPGFVETAMTAKNHFPMPFLMNADRAARLMADAIEAKRRTLTYPWQMRWLERLMKVAPPVVFDHVMRSVDKR